MYKKEDTLACKIAAFLICCLGNLVIYGQSFYNGDLDGIIGSANTPNGWVQVPFGDPVSNATSVGEATSDVTGLTGPYLPTGINGNPYSGNTFTSGVHSYYPPDGQLFREGIMQNVNGLIPGENYQIRFYQTVVKQAAALDSSGSWSVFVDSVLIGITAPTLSSEPYNSNSLPWELRTVNFKATNSAHLIKFLPTDDDLNITLTIDPFSANGIRMGIDSISLVWLQEKPQVNIGNDTTVCEGEILMLNANCLGCSYHWQNGSTSSNFEVTQGGTYWVQVSNSMGTETDSINVLYFTIDKIDLPNVITVNHDGVNDELNFETYFQNCQAFNLTIMNRWGQLVYEYSFGGPPFIGKSINDEELMDGVYFYMISSKENNKSGYIHIIH